VFLLLRAIKLPIVAAVQGLHDADTGNLVGPANSTTNISASIAACHSGASASFFGSAVM
jgi:hypothetical protein